MSELELALREAAQQLSAAENTLQTGTPLGSDAQQASGTYVRI